MILINPNYLFNHVIFINPEKRFILIENEVYRKVHSIIFKGRHSTPKQRKKLRMLFYESYYNLYFKGIEVDHQSFNNKILDIYRNDSVISFDHTTQVENELGDVILDNELPYYVPEDVEVGEEKVFEEESIVRKSLLKMNEFENDYKQDLFDQMNLLVLKSYDYQLLVNHLGIGKIRGIFSRFIYSEKYRIYDDYEFYFIKSSLSFLARFRLQFFDRKFDFLCKNCLNISSHHIDVFAERKGTPGHVDSCYETYWFNRNGIIKEQVHSDHLASLYHDKMFTDDGKLVCLSYRTYLQIGLYHADLNTKYDFETIIIMNNNKVKRDKLESDINTAIANHPHLSRGYLPFMIVISDLLEEQNKLVAQLDKYEFIGYDKLLYSVHENYIEIVNAVDQFVQKQSDTSVKQTNSLDNLFRGRF